MQKCGYSLINENNIEITYWGDVLGVDVSMPNPIHLPNGDVVYSPELSSYQNYKLVERWIDGDINKKFLIFGETIAFDGTKIVVTWQYRQPNEKEYAEAIQKHIDETAQSKGYENGISLASYDSSTNVTWANEAQTFIAWRDDVWEYAFTELEKVKSGQRQQPTLEELLRELPAFS